MKESKVIDIVEQGDVAIVSFLVPAISSSDQFESMAKDTRSYLADYNPQKLVVDFTGVKFFSSQVLGLLVDAWKKLNEHGGSIAISGIIPGLGRVFKITHLETLFDFYPDTQSAIKALRDKA